MAKVVINNAFSTKMLQDDATAHISIINEEEFKSAIQVADEIVIGHQDTADYFGVALNRQTIHLDKGDVLFVCEANSKTGGRLPSGTEFLEQMGDGFYFRFLKIEII
mgnify:CR=1 FL=1